MKLRLLLCCVLAAPGAAFGGSSAGHGVRIEHRQRDVKEFGDYNSDRSAQAAAHLQLTSSKLTGSTIYAPPGGTLEIFRNFEEALKRAGFQICIRSGSAARAASGPGGWHRRQLPSANALPRRKQSGPRATRAWRSTSTTGRRKADHHAYVVVIETKPMQQGMVKVDAAALAGDLTTMGHAAVYGIYFDTAKWDIKPESEKALGEIVKLLQQHTDLKLHIVGHTDNIGTATANLELSRKRADSVLKALIDKGIAASRLDSAGVGQYSPVATNHTEAGRAKNRRVELVEQ